MRDEYANDARITGNALGRAEKTAGEAMQAQRAKAWAECGIEEKVERIRTELLGVRDLSQGAYRNAREAGELAAAHQHNHNGEVLRPANNPFGGAFAMEGRGFDPLR